MPLTDTGFFCINLGIGLQNPHNSSLCEGTLYQQRFSKNMFSKDKPNITVLEDISNLPLELANAERVFAMPPLSTAKLQESGRMFRMPLPSIENRKDDL